MNGATHITEYGIFTSPYDFYLVANTVKSVVPYEDILLDGSLDEKFTGSNKKLLYTKRELGNRAVVLIGNYETRTPVETTLLIKGKITDLVTGKVSRADGNFTLEVPADDYAFILIEK